MWKIEVELENENKKSFSLEPSSTIGNLIHKLSETSENFNWSEFTLWNGEKNEWLDNPRNSLDQYQLYNGSKIQFLRTRLPIYIILPDFRIIRPIINMCSNILDVLKYVCELLGIRRYEEFSFIALHSTEDSSGSIGKDPKNKPKKGCEGSISLAKKIQEYFDRCELSEKKLVSYFDIEIPQYTADIFPNSNSLSDWCGLYENLVVSSWPLKNKDFSNDDILYLRFRYANFLDLNPRTDPVRFAFAFAYAAYAMKTQELKCEQEELLDLAAILWQVVMIQEKLIKVQDDSDSHNMVENIDNALDALESSLAVDISETQNSAIPSSSSSMSSILPAEDDKKAKLTVLSGSMLHIYKGTTENRELIDTSVNIKASTLKTEMNFPKKIYKIIILNVLDSKRKRTKVSLKFNDERKFVEWLAACRSVSRGLDLNHSYIQNERAALFAYLSMKKRVTKYPTSEEETFRYKLEDFFPAWIFSQPNCSPDLVLDRLLVTYMPYCMMPILDLKKKFIQRWLGIEYCNLIPFKVSFDIGQEKTTSKKKSFEILAIGPRYIARIDPSDDSIVEKWSYRNLRHWNINWQSNTQVMNFDSKKVTLVSLSCDIRKIHECIGGNIFMTTRTDPALPFDSSLFFKLTS